MRRPQNITRKMEALLSVLKEELDALEECQPENPKKRSPENAKKVRREVSLKNPARVLYDDRPFRPIGYQEEISEMTRINKVSFENPTRVLSDGGHYRSRGHDRSNGFTSRTKKKHPHQQKANLMPSRKPAEIRTQNPAPERDIPADLKEHITRNKGGHDIKLVIQKFLRLSDLNRNNHRFSIPITQIKEAFLTDEEEEFFKQRDDKGKKKSVEVTLIEPTMSNETVVTFTRWEMEKKNGGKTSSTYVLRSTWMRVVERNNLKEHDYVQLWSFRVGSELHLAMVIVQRSEETSFDP